jgi:hypothetical protein
VEFSGIERLLAPLLVRLFQRRLEGDLDRLTAARTDEAGTRRAEPIAGSESCRRSRLSLSDRTMPTVLSAPPEAP